MSKKRKHKNRHIPHTNHNSTQGANQMSPIATQPAQSSSPSTLPLSRSAPLPLSSSAPADIVFHAVKRAFAAETQSTDPSSPKLAQLMDNYVQGLNIVAMERIANLLEASPPQAAGSPQHLKLLRMLLQSLSNYTRNMSRIGREKAAAQREARARAKEAKELHRPQQAQQQLTKAQQTLARINNLQRAGAIETESKDATENEKNEISSETSKPSSSNALPLSPSAPLPLLSKDATTPAKNQNPEPVPALTAS